MLADLSEHYLYRQLRRVLGVVWICLYGLYVLREDFAYASFLSVWNVSIGILILYVYEQLCLGALCTFCDTQVAARLSFFCVFTSVISNKMLTSKSEDTWLKLSLCSRGRPSSHLLSRCRVQRCQTRLSACHGFDTIDFPKSCDSSVVSEDTRIDTKIKIRSATRASTIAFNHLCCQI